MPKKDKEPDRDRDKERDRGSKGRKDDRDANELKDRLNRLDAARKARLWGSWDNRHRDS